MRQRLFAASLLVPAALCAAEYRAQDGSFSMQVPPGWNAGETSIGGTPVQVLAPASGGQERILVCVTPAATADITQLAQSAVGVTTQLFPALRPAGMPRVNGASAEIRYAGNGASSFQMVALRNGQSIGITAIAAPDRIGGAEQAARLVAGSVRLAAAAADANSPLARIIVGRWTWYHRTHDTGSASRVVTFYPNGRYVYEAAVMMRVELPTGVDPTTRITGTYRVQGNSVIARADNGQSAQFQVQILDNGRALRVNGEMYIRE